MELKIDKQSVNKWVVFYAEDNTLLGYIVRVSRAYPEYSVSVYINQLKENNQRSMHVAIDSVDLNEVFMHAFNTIKSKVKKEYFILDQSIRFLNKITRSF